MASDTALLLIDVQVGLVEECQVGDELLGRLAGLVGKARAAGTPVVFVQHEEDFPTMRHGASGWQVHPAVAPLPGEATVRKATPDSFHATTLRRELDARGIGHLVVAGMQSDCCVDATCRRAIDEGYAVTLVADGHTTADGETGTAAAISAHHNDALGRLAVGDRRVTLKQAAEVAF